MVEPGEYSATLTATNDDGKCSDTKTIWFQVRPADDGQCGLFVDFGSQAHVASGALTHSQELFSTKGTTLASGMTLYYNSLDPHNGSLGLGWSHSYDIFLKENSDGPVVLHEGNGKRRLYKLSNGAYTAQPGDYSTLVKNADGTFTLTHKDGLKYNFRTNNKIAAIEDRNGNNVTFGYTGSNLTGIIDPAGHITTLSYDAANHLTSIIDPAGNSYLFSIAGNTLSSVTQPDGGTWRYTYDSNAFMLTKTDPLGATTTYAYDDSHRVVSSTDPEGKGRSISYPHGTDTVKTTAFTEKDGGVWGYSYDTEKGYLLSKTDPQGGTTSYTYDTAGNRLSTTLPDGSTTTYTYDGQGNTTSATDALGQTTNYTYNQYGQVLSVTDPQGNTTSYGYDANGNITSTTDPAGATTKYEYDAKGNVTRVINPLGQASVFTYDQSGNLVSMTDTAGAMTSFAYDAAGNMTSQTDAGGSTTRFEYNAKGRLVKMTDPQGNATVYTYDLSGNKTSETDANGNTTHYEYNYKGELAKVKDSLGNVTIYGYGGAGCSSCSGGADKLVSVTDANGNTTTYEYDQLGRLVKETDPLGNATGYSYDAKGNLISKTDANGNIVTYSYDNLGRLLKKGYPDGATEVFTYDAKGNILTAANQHIAYAFAYDSNGRALSVTDSNVKTISYVYDAAGNRTKMTTPEGKVISYTYDSGNRMKAINADSGTFKFDYDILGRRIKLTYPTGAVANYSYDNIGRLTNLVHKTSHGSTIASFAYTHDKVGNRLSKDELERKTTYGYDNIYQLLQALPYKLHGREREEEHKAETFTYDPLGNRLSGPRSRDFYQYIQGNQLVSDTKHQYSYDRNGNLIAKTEKDDDGKATVWTYAYDFENKLMKVVKKEDDETKTVSFKYDPFGRRIEKRVEETEDRGIEATIHRYVYDDQNIILEYMTKADDGKEKTHTTRYVHGPGIDEHMSIEQEGEVYYYYSDGLGSIVALTDKKQKVAESYEYDSFGNMKRHGDKVKNMFTYTSREWDKETGLYYYRARYYDPMDGRFISKDPIGFKGGINLYNYVQSNPINITDPTGLTGASGSWSNGNFTSGYTEQDGVCSAPAGIFNIWPCTKQCCKMHDECYARNGCNASSWLSNAFVGDNSVCEQCNREAVDCISRNIGKTECDDCTSGDW